MCPDPRHTANTHFAVYPILRRVFWIWAHDKFFLFSISNDSLQKKHDTTTTLPCAKYMAHDKPYFFSSINSTNLISKHVSLNLTKCTLQSIIKLTKHITRSAYFKILYFSMHVYLNLNIPTLILIVLKKF